LNGGPGHPLTDAVSFQVFTEDQAETDRYWSAIIEGGGEEIACSWCKDRFGLRWQIVPRRLTELMAEKDPAKSKAAFNAMMTMKKIDIAALDAAVEGVDA
jgi:2-polyprenyl-6-hydroxyphenyl methylase/3-demethylubiquinone-9 3-methyltransferase